jgi:hypothetical protein
MHAETPRPDLEDSLTRIAMGMDELERSERLLEGELRQAAGRWLLARRAQIRLGAITADTDEHRRIEGMLSALGGPLPEAGEA